MGLLAETTLRNIFVAGLIFNNFGVFVSGQVLKFQDVTSPDIKLLPENTDPGTKIGSLKLTGADNLVIKSQNSYVHINETAKGKGFVNVSIFLDIPLDFENDGFKTLYCLFKGYDESDPNNNYVLHTMTVIVKDVNEAPIIDSKPYLLNFPENQIVDLLDAYITARDVDANDRLTFTLIPSNQTKDASKFNINPDGRLRLVSELDFETYPFYKYTVVVKDKDGLNDSADVFITILDVQDKPPYFIGEPYIKNIPENAGLSKSVMKISAADGDKGVPNNVFFNITQSTETCKTFFEIHPSSGLITTKAKLNPGSCTLVIQATEDNQHPQGLNSNYTATATVTITIDDINDHAPEFSSKHYSVTVKENALPGEMINFYTPIAVSDQDQGNNALFDVSVITNEDFFEVTPAKVQSLGEIWIRVKNGSILDYEKLKNLTIQIQANDTLEKSHMNTTNVTVFINNTNDNSPIFDNSSYYGQIFENASIGDLVLTVNATDDDSNDDGHKYGIVTYKIEGSDQSFTVLPNTGQITVSSELNREIKDMYYFTVSAEDGGNNKASVSVKIKILDCNNNKPKFVTNYYQSSLKENGRNILPPITVLATDEDEKNSPNSEIQYSISSTLPPNLESHFVMNPTTGILSVVSPLDYENITFQAEYAGNITLIVVASDRGIPEQQSNVSVIVMLQDVNDNDPECVNQVLSIQVYENITKSSRIVQVNATDKDCTAPNNVTMFSIDSDSLGKFIIDSYTGILSLRDALNREVTPNYNVTVTVTDNGATPRSGSCTVNIEVMDINDELPNFPQKSYTADFPENTLGEIIVVSANDPDTNSNITYDINWQQCQAKNPSGQYVDTSFNFKDFVEIEPTGHVIIRQTLDREKVSEFVLQIVATDNNGVVNIPQNDTATVTVKVLDLNDESPVFNSYRYNASIRENMPVKSDIKFDNFMIMKISDADEKGVNSTFEIFLLTHNTTFEINPRTGTSDETFTISVLNSTALDYETTENFTLKVLAVDSKNTSMSNTATVFVLVINENDNIPEFIGGPFTASVLENSPNGTHITTVNATDKDLGDAGMFTFSLDDSKCGFIIDCVTGEVTLNQSLDREDKGSYTITLKVRDTGGFEGSSQLTITVLDVNDMPPEFQKSTYEVEFKEDSLKPIVPLSVMATDKDDPNTNNSKIIYWITEFPPELLKNSVKVSNGGEITLSKYLDYENLTQYYPNGNNFHVNVTAIDLGNPSLNSSALINVTILDVNDNDPVFTHSLYNGSVKEGSNLQGVIAAQVSATDLDGSSPNQDIYYVIQSGSRDKLQINTTTGEISVGVGATLDRESTEKDGFSLIVLAIDYGSPAKSSTCTVSIQVLDINDSPPEITAEGYNVYENASIRTMIANFTATDKDENPNLVFSINWSQSLAFDEKEKAVNVSLLEEWLEINSLTGIISVKSAMDREQVEQMVLKVVVTDENTKIGVKDATATVTVTLLDVNDNSPIITISGSQLNVSEGTKLGTEIAILTALDKDKDQSIMFSLANPNGSFSITDSGKLTLTKLLDREITPKLEFKVIATDNGSPPMSSNTTVFIDVLDINDYDPQFIMNQTTFNVLENSNNLTLVATMKATDMDAGDNGNVTFEFKDVYPFRIDPITGEIFVSDLIDREKTESFQVTVTAADNPVLEAIRRTLQPITIKVDDVNDNSPIFSSHGGYVGIILENALIGDTVSITPDPITATDEDVGINSKITFSISSNNSYFKIDDETGIVKVNQNITDIIDTFSFIVRATDHGTPALNSTTNLTISIIDVNNHSPKIFINGTINPIPQCANIGQSVFNFSATDADQDKTTNGRVKFSLDNTPDNYSNYFQLTEKGELLIGSNSGKLHPFDDYESSEMVIQIRATDCGDKPNSILSGPISIKIIDTNGNCPDFIPNINTNFSVMEGASSINIGSVQAFDKDRDSILTFNLTDIPEPWADHFKIISNNITKEGVIYVEKPLDREQIDQIKLKVTVNDNFIANEYNAYAMCVNYKSECPSHTAEVIIKITIEDSNDNPPVFTEKKLFVGFLSSTKWGETIINLLNHVTDNDTAPNSVHRFYQVDEIQPDSDIQKTWSKDLEEHPIRVDANGTISTNYKFSEGALGYFTLRVMANDSAGNDTTVLKIYVVGESQVIHLTVGYTEEQTRKLQNDIVKELSDPDHKFVADNILPSYDKNGKIISSMSVLVMHAIDRDENIINGKTLLSFLDQTLSDKQDKYKIYSTEAGEDVGKEAVAEEKDNRYMYILIGIIAVVAIIFVITLYLLIHTIRRFKRKLKAATIEVHGMDPIKQVIFPGLDNDNIKSNNPIFMRDDLNLDDSKFNDNYDRHNNDDSISNTSENSLDQNEIKAGREKIKSGVDEQELTIDVFEGDETEPGGEHMYQHLHFRNALFNANDDNQYSTLGNNQRSVDRDNDEDLDLGMSYRNFESTDI